MSHKKQAIDENELNLSKKYLIEGKQEINMQYKMDEGFEDNEFIQINNVQEEQLSVKYVQKQILEQLLLKSKSKLTKNEVQEIKCFKKEREDRAYWVNLFNEQAYLEHLYLQFRFSSQLKEVLLTIIKSIIQLDINYQEITDFVCEREDRILSEIMSGSVKCEKQIAIKKQDLFTLEDSQIIQKSPIKSKENVKGNDSIFATHKEENTLLDEQRKNTLNASQENILNTSQVSATHHVKQQQKSISLTRKQFQENSPQKLKEIYEFINQLQVDKQERLKRINKRKLKRDQMKQQIEFEELEQLKRLREEKREEFKKKLEKHNVQLKERQTQRKESDKQYKEFYKEYQQTKPLYTQMEEEFEEKEKIHQKVQEVVILSELKESRKPIDKEQLKNHMENYDRQRERSLQEIQSKRKQTKNTNETQNTVTYQEPGQKLMNQYTSANSTPKRNVDKEKKYSNMVRELFAPKIDEKKQLELNYNKEQLNRNIRDKKYRQLKVIQQKQIMIQNDYESQLNASFEIQTHLSSVQLNKSVDLMESKDTNIYKKQGNFLNVPQQSNINPKQRSASTNIHTKRNLYQNSDFPQQQYSTQLPNESNSLFSNQQNYNQSQIKGFSQNNIRNNKIKPQNGNFLMPIDSNRNMINLSFDTLDNVQPNSQFLIKDPHNSIEIENKFVKKTNPNGLMQISNQQQYNQQRHNVLKNQNVFNKVSQQLNFTPEKTEEGRYANNGQQDKGYYYNQENQLVIRQKKLDNVNNSSGRFLFANSNIYNEDDSRVIEYLQEVEMKRLGHSYLEYSRKQINRKKIVPIIETSQMSPIKQAKQAIHLIAKSNPVSPNMQKQNNEKLKYPNYLNHNFLQKKQEQGSYLNDWQKDINNQKLSSEQQLNKVISKAKSIDKKAELMESVLRNNRNQYSQNEFQQQKSQLDQHYVQSIQAKLALLNKFQQIDKQKQ